MEKLQHGKLNPTILQVAIIDYLTMYGSIYPFLIIYLSVYRLVYLSIYLFEKKSMKIAQ